MQEREWNKMITKLNKIIRTILLKTFPVNTPKKYESAINHLRIEHTHTHLILILMKKDDPPYLQVL